MGQRRQQTGLLLLLLGRVGTCEGLSGASLAGESASKKGQLLLWAGWDGRSEASLYDADGVFLQASLWLAPSGFAGGWGVWGTVFPGMMQKLKFELGVSVRGCELFRETLQMG
jgi:hypothetical protein